MFIIMHSPDGGVARAEGAVNADGHVAAVLVKIVLSLWKGNMDWVITSSQAEETPAQQHDTLTLNLNTSPHF